MIRMSEFRDDRDRQEAQLPVVVTDHDPSRAVATDESGDIVENGNAVPMLCHAFVIPPLDRQSILYLHEIDGLTYEQIAEKLGIREEEVRSGLCVERMQMRDAISSPSHIAEAGSGDWHEAYATPQSLSNRDRRSTGAKRQATADTVWLGVNVGNFALNGIFIYLNSHSDDESADLRIALSIFAILCGVACTLGIATRRWIAPLIRAKIHQTITQSPLLPPSSPPKSEQ